ncbi:serine/threonine protein kinase [Aliikangiella maris]|uniref:Serine/threonine-protein kinase n=2 Tax=Aliikangiella maris TaxID=3162458 RepID=A0ABV2BYX0_9GAMM
MSSLYEHFIEYENQPESQKSAYLDSLKAKSVEHYQELVELIAVSDSVADQDFNQVIGRSVEAISDEESCFLPRGTQVGAFTVESLLGRGGMGAVYLAHRNDGNFEQKVALKFLNPLLTYNQSKSILNLEAQALSQLNNPYIAKIYMFEETSDGRSCIVIEYVDGKPLDEYLAENNLSLAEKLQLMEKIIYAVQHAHTKRIVHGDLKPSNILINNQGEPKLIDFGVSRQTDRTNQSKIIYDYLCAFSFGYTSPEQIRGEPPTTLSDVYSLGAVLYFMLTGEVPGGKKTEAFTLINPIDYQQLDLIDKTLTCIVKRCLATDFNERFATPESMFRDIQSYMEKLPVRARQYNWYERFYLFFMRNKLSTSLVMSIVFICSIALSFISQQYSEIKNEQKTNDAILLSMSNLLTQIQPLGRSMTNQERGQIIDALQDEIEWNYLTGVSAIRYAVYITKAYNSIGAHDKALAFLKDIANRLPPVITQSKEAQFLINAQFASLYWKKGDSKNNAYYLDKMLTDIDSLSLSAEEFLSVFSSNDYPISHFNDLQSLNKMVNWLNRQDDLSELSIRSQFVLNSIRATYHEKVSENNRSLYYLEKNLRLMKLNKGIMPVSYYLVALMEYRSQSVNLYGGRKDHDFDIAGELENLLAEEVGPLHPEYLNLLSHLVRVYSESAKHKVKSLALLEQHGLVLLEKSRNDFVLSRYLANLYYSIGNFEQSLMISHQMLEATALQMKGLKTENIVNAQSEYFHARNLSRTVGILPAINYFERALTRFEDPESYSPLVIKTKYCRHLLQHKMLKIAESVCKDSYRHAQDILTREHNFRQQATINWLMFSVLSNISVDADLVEMVSRMIGESQSDQLNYLATSALFYYYLSNRDFDKALSQIQFKEKISRFFGSEINLFYAQYYVAFGDLLTAKEHFNLAVTRFCTFISTGHYHFKTIQRLAKALNQPLPCHDPVMLQAKLGLIAVNKTLYESID